MKKLNKDKLKSILEDRNITQTKLADGLDLTPPTISAWLNGKKNPDNENLKKICEFLDVSVNDITDEMLNNTNKNHGDNSVNCFNVYNSTLNIGSNNTPDILFTDSDLKDSVLIGVNIERDLISLIIDTAMKNNQKPSTLLREIIKKSLKK